MTNPLIQRYSKASESCALFHLENWAVIRLLGKDTRDYLNRMSTADLRPVKKGDARQTLFIRGDGRLVADTIAVCLEESKWLLVCSNECRDALLAQLDRFIFTEDVAVSDATKSYYVGVSIGPRTEELTEFLLSQPVLQTSGGIAVQVTLAPAANRGLALIPMDVFAELKSSLYTWLETVDGVIGDQDLYEAFRIEAGCPATGTELIEKTIPLEASLKPAISFTKGCFPGQEVVARINNLGHPANVLVGVRLPETSDDLVNLVLSADGKTVGRITSFTFSPKLRSVLGLGYVKWAHREPGTTLTIEGMDRHQAVVIELPLPGAES